LFTGFTSLSHDVFYALEGGLDGNEIFGRADCGHGFGPRQRIPDIVRAGGEHCIDYVIGNTADLAQVELKPLAEEITDSRCSLVEFSQLTLKICRIAIAFESRLENLADPQRQLVLGQNANNSIGLSA